MLVVITVDVSPGEADRGLGVATICMIHLFRSGVVRRSCKKALNPTIDAEVPTFNIPWAAVLSFTKVASLSQDASLTTHVRSLTFCMNASSIMSLNILFDVSITMTEKFFSAFKDVMNCWICAALELAASEYFHAVHTIFLLASCCKMSALYFPSALSS